MAQCSPHEDKSATAYENAVEKYADYEYHLCLSGS